MTDNEKAAIAAGLWEPWSQVSWRVGRDRRDQYGNTAPDMTLPANLWRALENVAARGLYVDACFYLATAGPYVRFTIWPKEGQVSDEHPPLAEARGRITRLPLFAALVELYDAENPAEAQKCQI